MNLSGWGQRPLVSSSVEFTSNATHAKGVVLGGFSGSIRGLGRSYGDSSLAESSLITTSMNHFISFDTEAGEVVCEAGVSLGDILGVAVPKGWFLPVSPGTKYVTVGGAIASDVHGKNHHINGCISEFIGWIDLLTAKGEIIRCSAQDNQPLFYATCGGMGLTGLILRASVKLKAISSAYVEQKTIKTSNLKHTLEVFQENFHSSYSVAWIDCLSSGAKTGRCLLTLGEHQTDGAMSLHREGKLGVPFNLPSITLNPITIKLFNASYYGKVRESVSCNTVHYDPYFYPLDSIQNWNRIYGKNGFIQYQFVVPYEAGFEALTGALNAMAKTGSASFLAVLKHLGDENKNYLSFPMKGYTLAVDFKWNTKLHRLISYLDALVIEHGGRVYLTKDSCMSAEMLRQTYARVDDFISVKKQYDPDGVFYSMQSRRLEL